MKSLPWFRFYHEAIDDEKLGLLAFEDRWHFVAILCLKCKGVLDSESNPEMLNRKVALKMGLTTSELEKVAGRLDQMGLINAATLQPIAWDERQMRSDSSTERVQAYRDRMKQVKRYGNVSETAQDTDKEEDKDKEVDKKKKESADAPPNGVSLSVWQDFKAIRKTKKAALTQTALKQIQAQADKAGVSLQTALETCCERGWASYNADWVSIKQGYQAPQPNQTVPSKPGIDPTLARMIHEQTSGAVKPPSPEIRARLSQLSGARA